MPFANPSVSAVPGEWDLVAYRNTFNPFPFQATVGGKPYRLDVITFEFVVKSKLVLDNNPSAPFTPDMGALIYKTPANGGILITDSLNGLFEVLVNPADMPATPAGLLAFPEGRSLWWSVRNLTLSTIMAQGRYIVNTPAGLGM